MAQIKRVSIAIVIALDRYLVGVRGPNSSFAGYDEFPGGKCLPDESSQDCAIRETLEETGLHIIPRQLIYQHEQANSHSGIRLDFWKSELADFKPEQTELPVPSPPFTWVTKQEIIERKFPTANDAVIRMLRQGSI